MEWFRSAIGLTASFPEEKNQPKSALADVNTEERQAKLLKTQRLKLKGLKFELSEVGQTLEYALDSGNKVEARSLLQRQRQLQSEISILEGQIQNQEVAQRTISQADSNREQAILMKDGANKLNDLVQDTEKIDLDEIVDSYQDGAARTHEFSTRLSEPLFTSSALNDDGQDVDEELDAMMQRTADRKTLGLKDVNPPKTIPPVKPHPSLQQQNELLKRNPDANKTKEKDY